MPSRASQGVQSALGSSVIARFERFRESDTTRSPPEELLLRAKNQPRRSLHTSRIARFGVRSRGRKRRRGRRRVRNGRPGRARGRHPRARAAAASASPREEAASGMARPRAGTARPCRRGGEERACWARPRRKGAVILMAKHGPVASSSAPRDGSSSVPRKRFSRQILAPSRRRAQRAARKHDAMPANLASDRARGRRKGREVRCARTERARRSGCTSTATGGRLRSSANPEGRRPPRRAGRRLRAPSEAAKPEQGGGGSQICEHGRRRFKCKECGG